MDASYRWSAIRDQCPALFWLALFIVRRRAEMICKLARKYIRREISEIWVCDGAEAVDKGGKAAELAGLAADSVSRG